jgi:hypothetical protein
MRLEFNGQFPLLTSPEDFERPQSGRANPWKPLNAMPAVFLLSVLDFALLPVTRARGARISACHAEALNGNSGRMTEGNAGYSGPSRTHRYVPLLVWTMAALAVLIIPLRIISYGYLPPDDALADAAKAVCGKPWPELLVLKSDYVIDNHIGWHTALRWIYLGTNWNDEALVLFSMAALFTLAAGAGLPWLKRPEAWLIALILVLGVQTPFMRRFMMGRPFLWSEFSLVTILFLWQARGLSPPDGRCLAAMTGLIAVAVLLHGVWYFWALPLAAFFLARQYRWAWALGGCWIAGTLLAAVLTGHPVDYLLEAWRQAWNVIGRHATARTLVSELRPTGGNWLPLLLMGGLLVLRALAKLPARPLRAQPAFWLACIGWVLGFQAERFWDDWGLPALMVLMAVDADLLLESRLAADSFNRLAVAAGLALALFITTTNDVDSRWTSNLATEYLTAGDARWAGWLPEADGIFYAADMEFFYQTFFRNPNAPWRYAVGFEPAFMPEDDFATFQQILWNKGNPEAYKPWVKKLRPQDRLAIRIGGNPAAFMPELEWTNTVQAIWIGRKK